DFVCTTNLVERSIRICNNLFYREFPCSRRLRIPPYDFEFDDAYLHDSFSLGLGRANCSFDEREYEEYRCPAHGYCLLLREAACLKFFSRGSGSNLFSGVIELSSSGVSSKVAWKRSPRN